MKSKRKYIREAIRLVELTIKDKNYSDERFDYIRELLKRDDERK